MNLTNSDFEAISKALQLLPSGEQFRELDPDIQLIIIQADMTMANLIKKKKQVNKRTAQYIAEKRILDKNYAR